MQGENSRSIPERRANFPRTIPLIFFSLFYEGFPCCLFFCLSRNSLFLWSICPCFPTDLRVSARRRILVSWWGFPCPFLATPPAPYRSLPGPPGPGDSCKGRAGLQPFPPHPPPKNKTRKLKIGVPCRKSSSRLREI